MGERSAAMKITQIKTLHSRRKTEMLWKDNKISSRSPNEAELNKGRSLKIQRHYETLTINLKLAFNGGTKDLQEHNTKRSTNGGFYETLITQNLSKREEQNRLWNLPWYLTKSME